MRRVPLNIVTPSAKCKFTLNPFSLANFLNMLTMSQYEPGTILWLPKRRDISFSSLDPASTVPGKCFGHPILILAVDPLYTSALILIVRYLKWIMPSMLIHSSSRLSAAQAISTQKSRADGTVSTNTCPFIRHVAWRVARRLFSSAHLNSWRAITGYTSNNLIDVPHPG